MGDEMSYFTRLLVVLSLTFTCWLMPCHLEAASGDVTGAGAFGSVPDTVSVNTFSGSATSTYPISVPPGRAAVQPDIVIGYNSASSADGFLGRGWDIPFPFIQRSTRYGQPAFTWNDSFALR